MGQLRWSTVTVRSEAGEPPASEDSNTRPHSATTCRRLATDSRLHQSCPAGARALVGAWNPLVDASLGRRVWARGRLSACGFAAARAALLTLGFRRLVRIAPPDWEVVHEIAECGGR